MPSMREIEDFVAEVERNTARARERARAWTTARLAEPIDDDPGMGPSEPVSGIGEEAYEWFGRYGAGEAGIEFRRTNLTVTVTYGGNDVGADGKALDMNSDAAKNGARAAAEEVDRSLQRISGG